MLNSILTNILNYKSVELVQIWLLVISYLPEEKQKLETGYFQLAKLAIKQPNLETKEQILKIVCSNFEYFYKQRMKKIIKAISINYLEIYINIMVHYRYFENSGTVSVTYGKFLMDL